MPTTFTIQAKDKKGRDIKNGGDPFAVKLKDPKGNDVPVKLVDNGDGTYTGSYAPQVAGPHEINATLAGKPIKDMPKVISLTHNIFEKNRKPVTHFFFLLWFCIQTINVKHGAHAGFTTIESISFIVQGKDKNGEKRTTGGDDVTVQISGPNGSKVQSTVKDIGDGTYLCNYPYPSSGGRYKISVLVDGNEIKNSPFFQEIK